MVSLRALVLDLALCASCTYAFPTQVPIGPSTTTTAPGSTSTVNLLALNQELQLAASEAERLAILLPDPSNPSNITFQFVNNTVSAPTGGTVALADINAFPGLSGTNVAMAVGFINACGLNVPHSHPRANEFLTVVQGELQAGLILEGNPGSAGNVAGAKPSTLQGPAVQVNTTLGLFQGMVFPQGNTHYQFNPNCEPAVFAAAFDNKDPGRSQIARTFFSLAPDDVIMGALGELGRETINAEEIDELRNQIPGAFAELIESCAVKCGIITKPLGR